MGIRVLTNRAALTLGIALSCASAACDGPSSHGGQTGEEGGNELCLETKTDVDLDDARLGFSAQHLLELATGEHMAALYWQDAQHDYGPEHGESSVVLEVSSAAVGARFVDARPNDRSGQEIGMLCPDRIEVDVELDFVTEGGAFEETLAATLAATDARVALISAELELDSLGGAFAFDEASLGGSRVYALGLNVAFTEYGASGSLAAGFERRTKDAVSAYGSTLATFPADGSCSSGISVPLSGGEASASAGIELVNGASELVLSFDDERRLAVATELIQDGGPACMAYGSWSEHPSGSVFTGVALSLVTDDGSLDGELSGELVVKPAGDGSLSEVAVRASCGGTPAEFASLCGDWGVEVAGYDAVAVEAALTARPGSSEPSFGGTFTIRGETRPSCEDPDPNDSSSPGCPGSSYTTLGVVRLERD